MAFGNRCLSCHGFSLFFTQLGFGAACEILSLSSWDERIPFVPESIWIYMSGAVFIPWAYFLNRCVVSMNKHLYSSLALLATASLVFLLLPTRFPRELFPLPPGTDPWTRRAFETIRYFDNPVNCIPSLHVALLNLISLGFLEDLREWLLPVFCWATLCAVSALTTKQHTLLDVGTGYLAAGLFFWVFHRKLTYRFTHQKVGGSRSETSGRNDVER